MIQMETKPRSTLAEVRALVPARPLTPSELRHVLERQATRLLKLSGIGGPPVPIAELVAGLPRIEVKRFPALPTSGRTQWAGNRWVILVSADEPAVRQRFSLGHELAHVVWHPSEDVLVDLETATSAERLEQACEYFAACLLMPRMWIKRAYYDEGIQDVASLSRLFNVSWVAMQVRLEQLGLVNRPVPLRSAA